MGDLVALKTSKRPSQRPSGFGIGLTEAQSTDLARSLQATMIELGRQLDRQERQLAVLPPTPARAAAETACGEARRSLGETMALLSRSIGPP